jgi:branched-subunit amino acid ABC-type transport system permease component
MHNLVLAAGFGLITASVLALAGVGVTLQFGVTNYINFAYGSYLALAAYLAWELNIRLGINVWLAIFGASIAMAIFAVIVNRLLFEPFRRKGVPAIYLLIVTMGLWLILSSSIGIIWGPGSVALNLGEALPSQIGPFLFTSQQLLIIGLAVVILLGVHLLLTRTKLGKAMRAMSDDVDLAQASGIDAGLIVTVTWLLTGFLIGLAGCVLAVNFGSFQPTFGDDYLFVIFSAVILGGIGQPYGTMLGALIIGLATEMAAIVINPAFKTDIAFLILIVIIMVRPQGLIPARGRH